MVATRISRGMCFKPSAFVFIAVLCGSVNRRKARAISAWLETLGFDTYIDAHRFGERTRCGDGDPRVALCGVDNALARAALANPGFGLVVEAGLGAGPEAFRSLSVHTFLSSRPPKKYGHARVGQPEGTVEDRPAYQALKRHGLDSCGLAQLASRTVVAVPFVGSYRRMLGCVRDSSEGKWREWVLADFRLGHRVGIP